MLYNVLLGLETILSIIIVVLILLHRGRGSEAGAVFTGSTSATMSGSRSSTSFLTKLIASLSFVFILNSLSLAYIANRDFGSGSVILEEVIEAEDPAIEDLIIDGEDDLPVDDDIFVDELIDDMPGDTIETEPEGDASDIPILEEPIQETETEGGLPADIPIDNPP